MEPDNITVDSVSSIENILKINELSEDEFKSKIIKWFKDRGLLANMRTYMRYQMINYLKETQIGNVLAEKTTKQSIQSKERAIHFLVAEYLLHNQYYYSLSILVSEVSFLNVFPDMAAIQKSNTFSKLSEEQLKFRFDKNDIMEFIQSLGIFKNSVEAEQIYKFYLKNSYCSLLTIILRVLIERTVITSDSSSKSIDVETTNENETIYYKWNNVVYNLLKKTLLKNSNIYFIRDNIIKFFMNEFNKFQNDMETKQQDAFEKMKDTIENEYECKEMRLKENLLEMEKKFNKEMSFYVNTLTSKDEIITKIRCELKKFESFNENFQKLKQKYLKEEESKKRYKDTAQLLKHECLKLQEQLVTTKEQCSKKDSKILELNETIQKIQQDFDNKLKIYDVEINDLKLTNIKLKEELDQEKTGVILTQVKHQEEISKNNSLAAEITELKMKNQTLENYLNELNKRSDELNRQFQNTMKSLQTFDQNKTFESETLLHKKSSIQLDEKLFSSESETASTVVSIIDILNDTKHRLDNLHVETQLIENNYKKHCNEIPVRYAELWKTTQTVANQNVPIQTTTTVNDSTITDFEIKLKNELITNDMKVGTEDELEPIPELPQLGVSKLPPLFEELHTNILSSFHNFQSTVLEVSRDLNTFVQCTSNLSDSLIKPQPTKNDILPQEHKTNLKVKQLETSFLELNHMEGDIMDDFISRIDPLSNREWFQEDDEKTSQKPSISSNLPKNDYISLSDDWVTSLDNEKITHKSSSVQTLSSLNLNVSKSMQTIHDHEIKSDDRLKNFDQNQNDGSTKLTIYETSSMEFVCEKTEDNQLENIEEIEENIEAHNYGDDVLKETESEYVIEPHEIYLPPSQCDNYQIKNYSSSNHSDQQNSSVKNTIAETMNSNHNSDSINLQLKDQEEVNDTSNSHSLENIIATLVNQVYKSSDDIVSQIHDQSIAEVQEKEQSVHILEKISIDDITSNKSSNSNTPISTGFDNKDDDFWM